MFFFPTCIELKNSTLFYYIKNANIAKTEEPLLTLFVILVYWHSTKNGFMYFTSVYTFVVFNSCLAIPDNILLHGLPEFCLSLNSAAT